MIDQVSLGFFQLIYFPLSIEDNIMMNRCLSLAKRALGMSYPNPLVGSVIVHQDKIIGESWHQRAGMPHAEVAAIESVKDKSVLKNATLYVNLEPCSHFGKTPPCAHKIVEYGIPKVVIGCRDHAAHVNGKGVEYLKSHGVEVIENVLQAEAEFLNRRFFTFHTQKRPYIILKYAQSLNAYFAAIEPQQKWITNSISKQLVHKWRTEEQGILVGNNTAEIDRPQLNARLWKGNQPIRMLISKKLGLGAENFAKTQLKTLIFTEETKENTENVDYVYVDFKENVLAQIMHHLHQIEVQSIIIEGGVYTLNRFIESNLWDEARILTGNIAWESGIKSPELSQSKLQFQTKLGEDFYQLYVNNKR